MADDVQRNQQLIGLNAQFKVSDQTMLTELGYDYDQEVKKMIEETYLQNYLNELRAKSTARTQGEAQIIGANYEQRIQELAQKAQMAAQQKMLEMGGAPGAQQDPAAAAQIRNGRRRWSAAGWRMASYASLSASASRPKLFRILVCKRMTARAADPRRWSTRRSKAASSAGRGNSTMSPADAMATIQELKQKMPDIGAAVEKEYRNLAAGVSAQGGGKSVSNAKSTQVNMNPLPEKGAPMRAGAV